LYIQRNNNFAQMVGGLVAAFLIGYILPNFVLQKFAKRYKAKLQEALPDTIDLLGIVLGTGLALDQAMLRVSEEMQYIYPELANEFYTVVMQVRAGQERGKAFSQLVRRTGIEDIKALSAMIIQSERFGTSLSQALKVYADALRMRRRLRAEAAVKLEEDVKRRAVLAERKIALAESQAASDVKAAAVEMAAQASEAILAARLAKGGGADPSIDAALSQLGTRFKAGAAA